MQQLLTATLPSQALRIWHAAIGALRRSSLDGTLTAVSAAQRGAIALDAVVAEYGSHPLRQDSELDRLLLSVDPDAEAQQQSSATSPEQVCSGRALCACLASLVQPLAVWHPLWCWRMQALESWSASFGDALDSVEADVRAALGDRAAGASERRIYPANAASGNQRGTLSKNMPRLLEHPRLPRNSRLQL